MKTLIGRVIVAIGTLAGAASAEVFHVDLDESRTTSTPVARAQAKPGAQALAEAHMRRLSGLSRLSIKQRAEKSGFAYAQAKARYDQLLASEQFGRLVAALERDPYIEVVGR